MAVTPRHLDELTPHDFQRLAVDALRAHISPRQGVRVVDLGYGVADGGFDGVLEEEEGRRWRIEVKSTGKFSKLRKELQSHLKEHSDLPTLVLCRLALKTAQRETLSKLRSSPAVRIHDGAEICSWLREHAWLARAFGLGGPAWLHPADILKERPLPRLTPSEREAVEQALELLSTDPDLLVVHGPPGARPNVVVQVLAHRLTRVDPAGRAVAVMEPGLLDELGPLDVQQLSLEQGRLRVLSVGSDPQRRDWVVTEQRLQPLLHRSGLALVVPARSPRNLTRAAHPARVVELALSVPSKAERRAFAEVAAGRKGMDIDAWALWLEDIDHIDALSQPPGALEQLVWERGQDTAGRELAAWVALLGLVPSAVVEPLGRLLGCSAPWEVLQRLEAMNLLTRSDEGFRPKGRALRGILSRVWLWDDAFDRHRFRAQVESFEFEQHQDILRGLWAAATPGEDADPAGTELEALLGTMDEDAQRQMLRHEPEAFAVTPATYRRALALAREEENLGSIVIPAVRWQGQLAREALQLVVEIAPRVKNASRLARYTVDAANRIPSAAASEAMSGLVSQIEMGLSAEVGVPIAKGVLEVRLAATIEAQQNLPTGVQMGVRLWDEAIQAVGEAFQTAGDLLLAMLHHDDPAWREAGFECLGGAGKEKGFSTRSVDAPVPKTLTHTLQHALREAAQIVASLRDRPERIRRERELIELLRHRWAKDEGSARVVAAAIARDPESRLLHRLTAVLFDVPEPDRLVEGIKAAQVEARPNRTYEEDVQAIEAWLATAPSAEQFRALLVDAATLSLAERNPFRGRALALLAERRRDFFWPLIAEEWIHLPEEIQQCLVVPVIQVFGQEVADLVVENAAGCPSGLAARMTQYFADPLQVQGSEANRIMELARWILPAATVSRVLAQLAQHPHPAVRGSLEWWLCRWAEKENPDPDLLSAAIRALVAPPHGLPQLASFSARMRKDTHLWQIELGGVVESELLDALESYLPQMEARSDQLRWEMQPLVARLFHARPSVVWQHPEAFLSRYGDEEMLELVEPADALAVLRLLSAASWMRGSTAHLFDVLVARLDKATWQAEIRTLLEAGHVVAAAQWLSVRGLHTEGLELLSEILEALPEEPAGELIYEMVVGRGHRVTFSGPHKLDLFEEPQPFQVPDLVGQVKQLASSSPRRAARRLKKLASDLETHARASHGVLSSIRLPGEGS
jgi:hypothetical protein